MGLYLYMCIYLCVSMCECVFLRVYVGGGIGNVSVDIVENRYGDSCSNPRQCYLQFFLPH